MENVASTGTARKVFGERKIAISIIFAGVFDIKVDGDHYVLRYGFRLPVAIVKAWFVPGGFILADGYSLAETTVFNQENEECVMVRGGDVKQGVAEEVLIPWRMLYKISEASREAYPQE
jgi:hypothetical protein